MRMGQIFCSRGRPLENSRGRPVEFTGCPVKSTGRPLEFSRGRPLEQKIWPNKLLDAPTITTSTSIWILCYQMFSSMIKVKK